MARGVEKSLRAVILEARGTHKPEKSRFRGGSFFQSIFGVEKGGVMPRGAEGSHRGKWPVVP